MTTWPSARNSFGWNAVVPRDAFGAPATTSTQQLANAYIALGDRYYQTNHFRHALQAFDAGLALNPLDYKAYNKRGVTRVSLRDYAGAFADYTQAIAIQPNFYNSYINRGNLWVYLGDLAQQLGQFQSAGQHYQRALADYGQAIRINPMSSAAYENRSELYSNLGCRQQSLQDKGTVIRLQKMKSPTRFGFPICAPRFALVLANDDYIGTENDLDGGPMKDAKSMAKALKAQGFQVLTGYNLNGPQSKAKVAEFIQTLQQNPGAISLIYYSGHGGSINGNNYLVPTNFVGNVDADFEQNAVSVDYLLKQLKGANSFFNMIFLDACRTPLEEGPSFRSAKAALKQWETEPGPGLSNTWIEYASRPRMPALQSGSQGLYTKYLVKYMMQPDLNLKEVSMYTSYALEKDPIAIRENQHSRTQTDLSRTEPIAQAFSFARHCPRSEPQGLRLPFFNQA